MLIPHPQAVGTASEEMYFGLLAARRTRTNLLAVFPAKLPWPLQLNVLPVAFFDLESPYLLCSPASRALLPLRYLVAIGFGVVRLVEMIRIRMGRGGPRDSERGIPKGGQELLWNPIGAEEDFSVGHVEAMEWSLQYRDVPECQVSKKTLEVGRASIERWGISDTDWWVCLHVREPGFYQDFESSSYRNADIDEYSAAIEEVTSRGGWVLRLGDPSMKRVPGQNNVVDVAHDPARSSRLDAFLVSHCRAFIGMQSGLMDTALLFSRPTLITNMYGWLIGLPFAENSWGVFQHLTDPADGRPVSVVETMSGSLSSLTSDWGLSNVEYHRLSAQELACATRAFLDWADEGYPSFDCPLGQERRDKYIKFLETTRLRSSDDFDAATKYRLASRATPQAFAFGESLSPSSERPQRVCWPSD